MKGIIACARYAYMPNHLGYCGPDENENLIGYIANDEQDDGLKEILTDFQTLKPYLNFIARTNRIPDPFNKQVVEAYWIGNSLLESVSAKQYYKYLTDEFSLQKKIDRKSLQYVYGKLPMGAKPHHSFHVLNIFRRTGHLSINHTVETMDNCCISCGKVIKKSADKLLVEYRPLAIVEGKLAQGEKKQKEILTEVDGQSMETEINAGDLVTFHWNAVCEKITHVQAGNLSFYTNQAISLANLSL
ncbi:MAG: DUF6390 family protein [Patescibacteria group bacterium]|jgi:hypothetical protein